MRFLFLILCGLSLTACTNAGPYVTNISRTKEGDLLVEKCMLKHNAFMGKQMHWQCLDVKHNA